MKIKKIFKTKELITLEEFRERNKWDEKEILKHQRYGEALSYAKKAWRETGEIFDFGVPQVCYCILDQIKKNKFSSKMGKKERIYYQSILHKKMILYSFADKNWSTESYFEKINEEIINAICILKSFDENEKVKDVIEKLS